VNIYFPQLKQTALPVPNLIAGFCGATLRGGKRREKGRKEGKEKE